MGFFVTRGWWLLYLTAAITALWFYGAHLACCKQCHDMHCSNSF